MCLYSMIVSEPDGQMLVMDSELSHPNVVLRGYYDQKNF